MPTLYICFNSVFCNSKIHICSGIKESNKELSWTPCQAYKLLLERFSFSLIMSLLTKLKSGKIEAIRAAGMLKEKGAISNNAAQLNVARTDIAQTLLHVVIMRIEQRSRL